MPDETKPEEPAAPTPEEAPAPEVTEEPAAAEAPAPDAAEEPAAAEAPAPDAAEEPAAAETPAPAPAEEPAATEAAPAPPEEPVDLHPAPDPATCTGIAIGLDAFWEAVLAGEWDDSDLAYYLEPAGVLNGPLSCARCPEDAPQRAGILMTRAAWKAHTVYFDDGVNPDTYELSFPKEFGYVKPVAHYKDESREHEKFPWSKKY